ncbi:hypothetical protein MMC30_000262 [Trapelia coarctata]|nr:hypothetical protein [Trapelia coarctata]
MASSTLTSVVAAIITIVLVGAWVGGYLDRYQKLAQDTALDAMGENRASYGLKSTLKGQKLSDDKDLNNLQEDTANTIGGLVGKGGIGESVGSGLSQGL